LDVEVVWFGVPSRLNAAAVCHCWDLSAKSHSDAAVERRWDLSARSRSNAAAARHLIRREASMAIHQVRKSVSDFSLTACRLEFSCLPHRP
jgi:hypothetical protein